MNALSKFFLTTGLLLVVGFFQIPACSGASAKSHSDHSHTTVACENIDVFTSIAPHQEQQKHNVHAFLFENEEEHEVNSIKKRVTGDTVPARYFSRSSSDVLRFGKISLRYQLQLDISVSTRYITFKVFRI